MTANFLEATTIASIFRDELRYHCYLLRSVNGAALAKEVLVAQAVSLDVATILVTETLEAVAVLVAAIIALATLVPIRRAGMSRVCRTDAVRFPNVHLRTAGAVVARAGVWAGGCP